MEADTVVGRHRSVEEEAEEASVSEFEQGEQIDKRLDP